MVVNILIGIALLNRKIPREVRPQKIFDRALSYFVKMFGLSQYRIPIKIFTTISNFHAFDFRAPERFKYLRPVDLRARRFNLRAA